MDWLDLALSVLREAGSDDDRAAALALLEPELAGPHQDEARRLLARCHHLIVRGGAATLVREARSLPVGSPLRAAAEALGAAAPPVRLVRRSSTRPADDGRVRTIETGASHAGGVAFSADGAVIHTFVEGAREWTDDHGHARFQQWQTTTGQRLRQAVLGQFREEGGAFALSPDGTTLAVRHHRDIDLHDLATWPSGRAPRHRRQLRGMEGPNAMTFLDDDHLVADDSSFALVVWNVHTGERVAAGGSVGWHGHALAAAPARVLLGGCLGTSRMIGAHRLPSLAPAGCFVSAEPAAGARIRCEAIDVSPDGRWVVTGDSTGAITLWSAAALHDPDGASTVAQPRVVPTTTLGRHPGAVSAVRFVDATRLLSGDAGGLVLDWQLDVAGHDPASPDAARASLAAAPRRLAVHHGYVNGIAIHPDRHLAATSAEDGLVVLWDLRGAGAGVPGPVPPMRREQECRPHPLGLEVITDGVSMVVPRPGPVAEPWPGPAVAQDPDRVGVQIGDVEIETVDEPGPPQLLVRRGDVVVDVVPLDRRGGPLCALDAETLALVEADGHVSFWQLVP